jgi:hypothetical protein
MCWLACLPSSVSVPATQAASRAVLSKQRAVVRNVALPVSACRSAMISFMPPYSPAMYSAHIRSSCSRGSTLSRLCTHSPIWRAMSSAVAFPASAYASRSPRMILWQV